MIEERQFWLLIEEAWTQAAEANQVRFRFLNSKSIAAIEVGRRCEEMVSCLARRLSTFGQEDLLTFDRILERKLYDIDRSEIWDVTEGSDDTFLYSRGFIVALGEQYYRSIDQRPEAAEGVGRCEELPYISLHIYESRFGTMPGSGISRESGSNDSFH